MRALLPTVGDGLIEVGAGFGRLADEYRAFSRVVLLDSSEVHVDAARQKLVQDGRFEVVIGDATALPFPDRSFDAAVCVRVLHHFADPGLVIAEMARVLRPGGVLVVEFANKRNLKSIARRMLGRQRWSPFGSGSVAYKPFHFDHSPLDIRRALRRCGLRTERIRAASMFRLPVATRHLPLGLLVKAESMLQEPLGPITPSPSVFVLARKAVRPRPTAPRQAD